MKYQLLPPLTPEERAGLAADVKARGVLVPVEKDEDGNILDGHNRAEIADELGIDYPVIVRRFGSEREKREHVLKINLIRRHLDPLRWGQAFAKLLEEKGVATGRGARNDVTTSATVAEVAAEVGIPERTARQRVEVARKYDALPDEQRQAVDSGTKTVHKAHREEQRRKPPAEPTPAPDGDRCRVITGDAVEELAKLEAGSVRLAFADPPYNQKVDYGQGCKADDLPDEQYLAWCREWMALAARALTPDGSLWVLISDAYADHFGVLLRSVGLHRKQWLIWYESFGVCDADKRGFARSSRHLLWCVKNPRDHVFNPEAVTRQSARQKVYNDPRADPAGRTWDSVWGVDPPIPRLTGTCKERVPGFPTQLPLALLLPVIGCASDPGDLVCDPFCGSGTTGAAALSLGRRFVGIEKNPAFARLALDRLQGESNGDQTRG